MWTMIGQERVTAMLDRLAQVNQVPHALLFTGPPGVGKTRLATELAKALNCVGDDPPCQVCIHCRQIETGSHPDVAVVERTEGKDSIRIEQVRELRDVAALRAFQGKTKVYIVAGAEALTPQAADALLKTLEEPQPQVCMVLTATDIESVPETVVSRCRVVALHRMAPGDLACALVDRGGDAEIAERLARMAQGDVGWALRALKQPKIAEQRRAMIERLLAVPDLDLDARLQLAESLVADRKDRSAVRRHVELLAAIARDLLLVSLNQEAETVPADLLAQLRRQAGRLSLQQISRYLEGIRRAMARIDQNVDARLALEALLVNSL